MDLLFLGTSAGMPSKQRNVTGLAVVEDQGKGWYLVDCGEATQHQLLHTRLSMHGLKAIFITHIHGDHCYGLPGLLASAAMQGRKQPLTIVAPKGVQEWLEATASLLELYVPYGLEFVLTDDQSEWTFDNFKVSATALDHRVPSWAYRFTQRHPATLDVERLTTDGIPRGPIWNQIQRSQVQKGINITLDDRSINAEDYLLRPPSSTVVIGGDNRDPQLLANACKDAQVLVHEATYTREVSERVGEEFGHSDAQRVAQFAEQIGLTNLVLTHFSARYSLDPKASPNMQDIRQEAENEYRGRLFLAQDLHRYRLERSGELVAVAMR
ncbi:MAG: ribonuclease Z [Oceanobacter sp.]